MHLLNRRALALLLATGACLGWVAWGEGRGSSFAQVVREKPIEVVTRVAIAHQTDAREAAALAVYRNRPGKSSRSDLRSEMDLGIAGAS